MLSNCLIAAIIEKIKHPKNILYYIKKPGDKLAERLHILWKNKDGKEFHFTRNKGVNAYGKLLFKGHVEELHTGTIQKLNGHRLFEKA